MWHRRPACEDHRRDAGATNRGGFTLVELLVVMLVLSILASTVLFAMFGAQERARKARTQSTINKINAIIMPMYQAFQLRRAPIITAGMDAKTGAFVRLQALRELMKIEMPDRFTDITLEPSIIRGRTSRSREYLRRLNQIASSSGKTRLQTYEGAECLYLIITMSTSDNAGRDNFSEQEVGDVDEDGMLEFLDGWGHPISFIRWPAGFASPLQPFDKELGFRAGDDWGQGDVYHDWKNSHDPFDTRKLEPKAYAIYPLIYSNGGDDIADIRSFVKDKRDEDPYPVIGSGRNRRIDPYMLDSGDGPIGRQQDFDDDGANWHDNIHNHQLKADLK
ncbi:MAG: prepilin-type N-terminal cleavage/methylation domain-containing protein [Planctomycetes bacterium]|nr:prepilin-type N-terminal cleavage/methylation domain-containing protein [Planctomycetota bacterium]